MNTMRMDRLRLTISSCVTAAAIFFGGWIVGVTVFHYNNGLPDLRKLPEKYQGLASQEIARGALSPKMIQQEIRNSSSTDTTTSRMVKKQDHDEKLIKCSEEKRNRSAELCDRIEKNQVSREKKELFLDILNFILELGNKHNWDHFVFYGTLLGSWRHHGFIPYDIDVDIYFPLEKRREIISTIEAQKEYVAKQVLDKELKIYSNSRSNLDYYHKSIGRWRGPYMDMYFYTTDEEYVRCATFSRYRWLKSDIFPLHDRPFEHVTVPVPRNPLKILQSLYGKTSRCKMKDDIHAYNCKDLDGILPFVHRLYHNGTMIETLQLADRVIQIKNVSETENNMPTSPYSLVGFTNK